MLLLCRGSWILLNSLVCLSLSTLVSFLCYRILSVRELQHEGETWLTFKHSSESCAYFLYFRWCSQSRGDDDRTGQSSFSAVPPIWILKFCDFLSAERLDEDLFSVQKSIPDAFAPEKFSDAIASSSMQNSCISASCDMGSTLRPHSSVTKAKSSGGSIKTSSSTPRTPHSSRTVQTSNANTALSGARFFIDPDLSEDLQAKV